MKNRSTRKAAAICSLAFMAAFSGCGKAKEPWETAYPAKGVVNYKGKPLAGARITLVPQDSKVPLTIRPSAFSKADGTFEVGTYSKNDGAPSGAYTALIEHHPIVGSKESPAAGPNDLPPKYSDPALSNLVIEIGEKETQIPPLDLK